MFQVQFFHQILEFGQSNLFNFFGSDNVLKIYHLTAGFGQFSGCSESPKYCFVKAQSCDLVIWNTRSVVVRVQGRPVATLQATGLVCPVIFTVYTSQSLSMALAPDAFNKRFVDENCKFWYFANYIVQSFRKFQKILYNYFRYRIRK